MLENMKNIWLVGASKGIGLSLLREIYDDEKTIFVSSRSEEDLNALQAEIETKPNSLVQLPLDVTDRDGIKKSVTAINDLVSGLDMIFINAGICEYIDSSKPDAQLVRRLFETNFFGAVDLIELTLPLLRASSLYRGRLKNCYNGPKIVVVSSSVAYLPLPRAAAYGASKAAASYFMESLKIDLQHEGIDLRIVSPGFVDTRLTIENDFPMPFMISAEQSAKLIVRGLSGKSFDIHFPRRFTYLLKIVNWLPDRVKHKLVGFLSREQQ